MCPYLSKLIPDVSSFDVTVLSLRKIEKSHCNFILHARLEKLLSGSASHYSSQYEQPRGRSHVVEGWSTRILKFWKMLHQAATKNAAAAGHVHCWQLEQYLSWGSLFPCSRHWRGGTWPGWRLRVRPWRASWWQPRIVVTLKGDGDILRRWSVGRYRSCSSPFFCAWWISSCSRPSKRYNQPFTTHYCGPLNSLITMTNFGIQWSVLLTYLTQYS